ncbi:carbohydrate ABC transporter substrate-binding protein (CUT1 family) [Rhodovulum imhoffii]|uniref:Carbohydrate ABC transporter substrate-binding protein (CUT1 family) n=1 Tax=Rhodovulum imhoffii TaxID=365340 RepID=A0A2T5BNZ0_9RHOB|nr:extracellular solute-binding protein [Rhodovulum imhoffii]MBK5933630.1 ABC transporter substrate-binding protein [Rhodovulum imhoffii]PTN00713.1 carbohydrate ABC transporter substrate-binding protein (CUT1 family) [Rhodovulum imhoffii]
MNVSRTLSLAAALATGLTGAAWAEKEYEGVELKMLAIGDTSVTRLAPIVDEFTELTGAKVQIDMFPYPGLIDKIVIEASANNPSYQLMWVDSPWVGVLGESGALEDLTDLVKRDAEEIHLDDIIPIQLQENTWQGRLLAFPASGMIWHINYRKDLFEHPEEQAAFNKRYGYDLAPAKTWDQFIDIAEFFTRKAGETLAGEVLAKDFYGNAQAYSRVAGAITHDFFPIMRSFGGQYWDPQTGLCAIDREPGLKAAEVMKELAAYNPPDYLGLMWDIRTGYMERGEVAQSGYWSVRTVRLTNPDEAVLPTIGEAGYAPSPTGDGNPADTMTGALSFAINSKASDREKEAAWEFIKWGTSRDMMRRFANEGSGVSQFHKSILSDSELQKKYPYYQVLLETQERAQRRIFHPFYADVEEVFGVELNKYMAGETESAQEALTKGCTKVNTRLKVFPEEMRLRWINDVPAEIFD